MTLNRRLPTHELTARRKRKRAITHLPALQPAVEQPLPPAPAAHKPGAPLVPAAPPPGRVG